MEIWLELSGAFSTLDHTNIIVSLQTVNSFFSGVVLDENLVTNMPGSNLPMTCHTH